MAQPLFQTRIILYNSWSIVFLKVFPVSVSPYSEHTQKSDWYKKNLCLQLGSYLTHFNAPKIQQKSKGSFLNMWYD
jgi:hypothetical protein